MCSCCSGNTLGKAADPVCGMKVQPEAATAVSEYQGKTYYFCCAGCKQRFDNDPSRFEMERAL